MPRRAPRSIWTTPSLSRLVVRLRRRVPQLLDRIAATAATTMQSAIQTTDRGQHHRSTQIDPSLTISKALTLYDGTVASGGSAASMAPPLRSTSSRRAAARPCTTPAVSNRRLNLTISGDVTLGRRLGYQRAHGRQGPGQRRLPASKLHDLIKATGEYTFEAWVAPANVDAGRWRTWPATPVVRPLATSRSRQHDATRLRGAHEPQLRDHRCRTVSRSLIDRRPTDEDLQATLQHIVVTFEPGPTDAAST